MGKDGVRDGRCSKTSTLQGIFIVTRRVNTITRMVVIQGYRGTFSPCGKTDPAGHQPSILMSRGYTRFLLKPQKGELSEIP